VLVPDLLYICEDLSGKNGPMISADHYRMYIGRYYRELIPYVKSLGIKFVFVDTDGDFFSLIPYFLADGIDGFLPMDVNAGMDIIQVRAAFPTVKLIGGINKLALEQGKAAIDGEIQRVLPVIRQGGYLPGIDHQVTPQTSLANYRYYIEKLSSAMTEAGKDAAAYRRTGGNHEHARL
jgi:hypothetical protein